METPPADLTSAEKDTGRLEAFSDGVFSIAMTLLILELKVPDVHDAHNATALWSSLGRQWPSYFAFVTSFATVLIMWINHHGIFRLIRKCNANLLFANGLLLLLVTAVPWPTALIAAYLRTPSACAAVTVYAGLFVLVAVSYALVLMAAKQGNGKNLVAGAMPEANRRLRSCWLVGFPLYSLAAITAVFSPWPPLMICSGLWVFWVGVSIDRDGESSQ